MGRSKGKASRVLGKFREVLNQFFGNDNRHDKISASSADTEGYEKKEIFHLRMAYNFYDKVRTTLVFSKTVVV